MPNAGHNLGGGKQAFRALGSFFGFTAKEEPYPETQWKATVNGQQVSLDIEITPKRLKGVRLWRAYSADRDFRDENWTATDLTVPRKASITTTIPLPTDGYQAFYVDLIYKDTHGKKYSQSTRVFVTDSSGIL